jgi:pSer/pThr/pTyr-binding forkhead associated (FHA) protein
MAGRLFPAGGAPSIVLTKCFILIGRSKECDIRLDHSFVSSRHCALWWDGDHWILEDLSSRNGTAVNNTQITKHSLRSGDTFTVSKRVRFVIEYESAVEEARFAGLSPDEEQRLLGDERTYREHGPATKRLDPHDKDIWSTFEG